MTYIYEKGYGVDTINNYDSNSSPIDILKMRDISRDEVKIYGKENDLIIEMLDGSGKVIIDEFYYNDYYKIDKIEFSDMVMTKEDILALKLEIIGTDQDDYIIGSKEKELIIGGKGNDTIFGKAGDDLIRGDEGNDDLYGESGNDYLYGKSGDDIIDGGEGNDRLEGGSGNDIYI